MSDFNKEEFKKNIEEFLCNWKPKEIWFYTDLVPTKEMREEIKKLNNE